MRNGNGDHDTIDEPPNPAPSPDDDPAWTRVETWGHDEDETTTALIHNSAGDRYILSGASGRRAAAELYHHFHDLPQPGIIHRTLQLVTATFCLVGIFVAIAGWMTSLGPDTSNLTWVLVGYNLFAAGAIGFAALILDATPTRST